MKCRICERTLDDPSDPTTRDCGGDCLRCMAEAGDPECVSAMEKIKKPVGTVDMTPSWAGVVNVYLGVLENPAARPEARAAAHAEIRRMATIADAYVAMQEKLTEALNDGAAAITELAAKLRGPRSQQKEKQRDE